MDQPDNLGAPAGGGVNPFAIEPPLYTIRGDSGEEPRCQT